MNRTRTLAGTALLTAALAVPLLAAVPANAQGGRPGVQASGSCSQSGTWKLKAKADDPSLVQVEFEVDTNVVGQTWAVRITDGATVVFSGRRTTTAPSGSFTVARRTADQPGTDTIRATATRGGTTCAGVVRL